MNPKTRLAPCVIRGGGSSVSFVPLVFFNFSTPVGILWGVKTVLPPVLPFKQIVRVTLNKQAWLCCECHNAVSENCQCISTSMLKLINTCIQYTFRGNLKFLRAFDIMKETWR